MHKNVIVTGKGVFNLSEAEYSIKKFIIGKDPGELHKDLQDIILILNEQRIKKAYPNDDLQKLINTITALDIAALKCRML